jgi:ABC-type transporter Mla subunit MlaD
MRPRRGSIAANPVLVGAVTVLVATVAVFLSYNANSGLPFVPTRIVHVHVGNGANLLPGNDVREGGFRIGIVDDMRPVQLPDGSVGADVVLKLDKKAGAVPVDSRVDLRPRSVLGLKYVELTRGASRRVLADGGTLPASQATFPVELDQLYGIFDE